MMYLLFGSWYSDDEAEWWPVRVYSTRDAAEQDAAALNKLTVQHYPKTPADVPRLEAILREHDPKAVARWNVVDYYSVEEVRVAHEPVVLWTL